MKNRCCLILLSIRRKIAGITGIECDPLRNKTLVEIIPAQLRHTGSSLAFNLSGILGASLTPYIAMRLAKTYGLEYAGYSLCVFALVSLLTLWAARNWSRCL